MTLGAIGTPSIRGKLTGVGILVAPRALLGRRPDHDILHRQFEVGRFVAIEAGNGPVGSNQRIDRRRVVETPNVTPYLGGVAGLAAERFPVWSGLSHSLRKLTLVGIKMAAGACQIIVAIGGR